MSATLQYKGYHGSVEYSAADRLLYGKLLGIRDMITFEGCDVVSLEASFQAAVDDYLEFCKETGRQPDQPFSGTFNIRTGVDLHRRAALYAEQHQLKLNNLVKKALEQYLERAG